MNKDSVVLVTGAGGFIGGHIVAELIQRGFGRIRGVDIKPVPQWFQVHPEAESLRLDLDEWGACQTA